MTEVLHKHTEIFMLQVREDLIYKFVHGKSFEFEAFHTKFSAIKNQSKNTAQNSMDFVKNMDIQYQ